MKHQDNYLHEPMEFFKIALLLTNKHIKYLISQLLENNYLIYTHKHTHIINSDFIHQAR